MIERKTYTTEVGGKKVTVEISEMAEQANAAVVVKCGGTAVLTTVVMEGRDASTDYLPLKVDYEERFYAAGKIIGSRFIRRESRPSDDAILAGRLVDRTIRPLFDQRIRREIQVVVTVLAYDEENEPELVGLVGASTALALSDVPWSGPVGGVRVARLDGQFVVNPDSSKLAENKPKLDAFVAGSRGRTNMIELAASDAKEGHILEVFKIAQKEIDKLVDFQKRIVSEMGKKKAELTLAEPDPALKSAVAEFLKERLEDAVYQPDKLAQKSKIGELKTAFFLNLKENFFASREGGKESDWKAADFLFEEAINDLVHEKILKEGRRPDGRKLDEVRALRGEAGLYPRTHGSALFVRGNTQALGITTLAPPGQEQFVETMEATMKRRFMLHYNFPPYSVGEIGSFRGPGRREIGHGYLARKAVEPILPPKEEFPYTIRVVSEILSSNGSSSMATVCAATLSLMDAGVPIKKPAAGIAMGLMMKDEKNFKVLTDIQGPEDHHGDMDFKVAGTEDGVNALQMDVKVDGLTVEILEKALAQAREARLHILKFMKGILPEPRRELSPYVPKIAIIKINPLKIGTVIGPGGKMINGLIEKYGLAGIDIDEDGSVFVSGQDKSKVDAAITEIQALTKEYKVGDIVEGNIIKLLDFGAIVDLGGGQDGMVHISEFRNGFVKDIKEVAKLGDFVRAKVVRVEEDRIALSVKQLQG